MLLSSISFDKLIVFFAIVLTIHFDIFFFCFYYRIRDTRHFLVSFVSRETLRRVQDRILKKAEARLIRKRRLSCSLCRRVPRDSRKTETKGRKNRHFDVLTGTWKGKEDV